MFFIGRFLPKIKEFIGKVLANNCHHVTNASFFEREAGRSLLNYSQSDGQGTPCDSGTVAPL